MVDDGNDAPALLQTDVFFVDFLLLGTVKNGEDARMGGPVKKGQEIRDETETRVVRDGEA